MILKNSIRQILRTPIKTTLFVLLLAAITTFLCFGVNMWLNVTQSLEQINRAFTTIGVVNCHNRSTLPAVWNPDFSPIINSKYVELFDRRGVVAGLSEDITVRKDAKFHRSGIQYSVIEIELLEPPVVTGTDISHFDGSKYTWIEFTGKVLEVRHSYGDSINIGHEVVFRAVREGLLESGLNSDPEPGKKYIALVSYPNKVLDLMVISGEDYLESGEIRIWTNDGLTWAELIERLNNSVHTSTVYTTNDIETMLIFHQGNAAIISGRSFSREDYEKGNRVCIISSSAASRNGLKPGDTIPLAFYEESIQSFELGFLCIDSVTPNKAYLDQGSYEIIGIYKTVGNMWNYGQHYGLLEDTIFIPQNAIAYQQPERSLAYDNTVSFRLTTGTAEAFMLEMEQYELPDITITIYDQGYAKISGALASMWRTALMLTAVCAAAGLVIVILFSLLFVGKQKRSIAIMFSLGTSRRKVMGFLMATVLTVSGLAVSIGGLAGYILSDKILADVYARNVEEKVLDASYSGYYGGGTEVNFQVTASQEPIAPFAAAGSVLVLTLALSGIFAVKTLKAEPMQVLTEKED